MVTKLRRLGFMSRSQTASELSLLIIRYFTMILHVNDSDLNSVLFETITRKQNQNH